MPRWKVLVSAPHALSVMDRYRRELNAGGCDVVFQPTVQRLREPELVPLIGGIHGIICGDDEITEHVLDAASDLRVISKWGTGLDSIDLAAAAARGITVCNTPEAFSEPVADTAMGYVLLFARKLDQMNADVHAGGWVRPPTTSLQECSLGVVGVGSCGRAVVRRAAAFGMRILACDRKPLPEMLKATPRLAELPLEELLAQADFVTLHADLNPTSYRLLNGRRIALMKPTAFLINTARGGLVDQEALTDALKSGKLSGAALDVFEEEPLPPENELRTLPNVYLAPHAANGSPAAAERVHENTIRNLLTALNDSRP